MKQIRRSVFETNSSSMHSVAIKCKGHMYDESCLLVDVDDYVHVRFGEFGWEIESYIDAYSKLQYIVTMLVETEGRNITSVEDLFETDGFKLINNAIADYCHCNGIWIDEEMKMKFYEWDGRKHWYLDHEGYIDHQSHEDYRSVQDFLDDYGVNITDFIFNSAVIVHTDNDNH